MKVSKSSKVITALAIAAGLTLLGSPAFAHTPVAESTCAGLSVNLTNYQTQANNPGKQPNRATVWVDGAADVRCRFAAHGVLPLASQRHRS